MNSAILVQQSIRDEGMATWQTLARIPFVRMRCQRKEDKNKNNICGALMHTVRFGVCGFFGFVV